MKNNQSQNKKPKSNNQDKNQKRFDQKKNTQKNTSQSGRNGQKSNARKGSGMSKNKESSIMLIGLTFMIIGAFFIIGAYILKKNANKNDDGFTTSKGAVNAERTMYSSYGFGMGTSLSVNIYGKINSDYNLKSAEDEADRIYEDIKLLDIGVISWRYNESVIGLMNSSGKLLLDGEYAPADDGLNVAKLGDPNSILYNVIKMSLTICNDSEGALDITIRPLLDAWQIETYAQAWEEYEPPALEVLRAAKNMTGFENITVSDEGIDLGGMFVDLGAVGKGYVLDYISNVTLPDIAENSGIKERSVVLSVGGSILVYGTGNQKKSFKVGVRDPEGTISDTVGYLEFPADCGKVCVSTSGSYEKYIENNGVRYHHIINPTSMRPAESGLVSVTVICDKDSLYPEYSGLVSDGLSTACFVLGKDKALKLLEKYNAEAVFIDTEGNITTTDGIKDIFKANE